jgi:Na+-driven multidrug efflux pump
VRAFVTRAAAISVVLLAVPGLVLCWRPALWIGLFTDDPGIHAVGTQYFRIIGPSYPFIGVSMVLAFAFQGLGRATIPLVWMIVRVAAVLVAAIVCTQGLGLGERAVFTVIAAGNVASTVGMVVLFALTERRLRTEVAVARADALAATGTR